MVSRNPNTGTITYTSDEQDQFDLPPEVTADDAIYMAVTFMHVAAVLQEAAHQIDVSTSEGRQQRMTRCSRANQLGRLANSIFELCPDEHLELITNFDPLRPESSDAPLPNPEA